MTMTLISSPNIARARSVSAESRVAHVAYASAAVTCSDAAHAAATTAIAPSTGMNLWLGCATQGKGFTPKFATKRFIPGRLEAVT